MRKLFIVTHLGLGDHIVIHGIVKYLSESYHILLPCKYHNLPSVQALCEGLNVTVIAVRDDQDMVQKVQSFTSGDVLALGYFGHNFMANGDSFDVSFYKQAGIEFEESWNVDIPDGFNSEILFLGYESKPYVFVHQDIERGYNIRNEYLPEGLDVVEPSRLDTIFDYTTTIRNAKEIHCIDSSFALMIDRMRLPKDIKKYIHLYSRQNAENPQWIDGWEIVK